MYEFTLYVLLPLPKPQKQNCLIRGKSMQKNPNMYLFTFIFKNQSNGTFQDHNCYIKQEIPFMEISKLNNKKIKKLASISCSLV